MENITFYAEWLPLDKKEFRILAMLADVGEFSGNLTDMCNYFSLNPQTRNKHNLRNAIESLNNQGFIESSRRGYTYTLKVIPKEKELLLQRESFLSLKNHEYSSENVAWIQVLKVFLWLMQNNKDVFTNDDIANDLRISTSTIGLAKNVLEREYNAILRKRVSEKTPIGFRTIGQNIIPNAWFDEIK